MRGKVLRLPEEKINSKRDIFIKKRVFFSSINLYRKKFIILNFILGHENRIPEKLGLSIYFMQSMHEVL